jgi:putative FmdB family regulatory protein
MSTYDYQCLKCRRTFVVHMPIGDHGKHPIHCPKCRSRRVRQRIESFYAVTTKKT